MTSSSSQAFSPFVILIHWRLLSVSMRLLFSSSLSWSFLLPKSLDFKSAHTWIYSCCTSACCPAISSAFSESLSCSSSIRFLSSSAAWIFARISSISMHLIIVSAMTISLWIFTSSCPDTFISLRSSIRLRISSIFSLICLYASSCSLIVSIVPESLFGNI